MPGLALQVHNYNVGLGSTRRVGALSATLAAVHLPRLVRRPGSSVVLTVVLVSAHVGADGPVLHEYIPPDPAEDLLLEATTVGGKFPAAIDTPSGVVSAPDVRKSPHSSEMAYGSSSTPTSRDSKYRIDRLTTQPDFVSYHDPFIPSVAPFKRLYAYDAVNDSLELAVSDSSLTRLPTEGAPRPGDDQFYGDLVVDLSPNVPVRIPSVGPGARVLAAAINPGLPYELLRDGADNWFIRSSARRRVRLTLQLAIDRRSLAGKFAPATYATLAPLVPRLPDSVRPSVGRVLAAVGVSTLQPPAEALRALVQYFRSFVPSASLPVARAGSSLYEELSLGQKGVCRHRAYSFVITALALGIPARMVRNEAHAWVEAFDGELWHRIDLGGAAGTMRIGQAADAPQHRPPADPYPWPEGSQSGMGIVQQSLAASGSASERPSTGQNQSGSHLRPSTPPLPPETSPTESPSLDPATLRFKLVDRSVRRGDAFGIHGSVHADGQQCGFARVDVGLRDPNGQVIPVQSLPTNQDGEFESRVTLPPSLEVGRYEVVVSTPGTVTCGAAKTR